jgi:hypothetical protein
MDALTRAHAVGGIIVPPEYCFSGHCSVQWQCLSGCLKLFFCSCRIRVLVGAAEKTQQKHRQNGRAIARCDGNSQRIREPGTRYDLNITAGFRFGTFF